MSLKQSILVVTMTIFTIFNSDSVFAKIKYKYGADNIKIESYVLFKKYRILVGSLRNDLNQSGVMFVIPMNTSECKKLRKIQFFTIQKEGLTQSYQVKIFQDSLGRPKEHEFYNSRIKTTDKKSGWKKFKLRTRITGNFFIGFEVKSKNSTGELEIGLIKKADKPYFFSKREDVGWEKQLLKLPGNSVYQQQQFDIATKYQTFLDHQIEYHFPAILVKIR
ncbi:hypothetical protein CLV98_1262 [Dyadobacter jejuensis]|uniref:Uncharacterized protein n=1 Tax=Dyadobacter jejuensis TaxID=1082580 RepID=A0A316A691_9BACT|nr:hypothetical protein [Dyadobacter jejuensis]PWJ53093.1 hypothetical protein CLV98_1262 [Dyadobacter jejuensis]